MLQQTNTHGKYSVLIVILYGVIMLFGLDKTPLVWLDEVTLNSPAYELVTHGKLRSGVFADNPLFKESYYWQPPGQPLLTSLSYKVFGFGIWQTRIPQILCAMFMLYVFTALLYRVIGDSTIATISALCFCFDPQFIYTARSGRMDAQCVLFIVCALWFCLRIVENRQIEYIWFAVLCGLSVGVAGLTHPIAIAYGVGFGCVILIVRYKKPLHIVMYALSAALPLGLWMLTIYLASDYSIFSEQFLKHGSDHIVQLSLSDKVIAELRRYLHDYKFAPHIPLLFISIILTFFVVFRKSWKSLYSSDNRVAILVIGFLFLVTFGFNVVMMTKDVGFYSVYPAIMLYSLMGIVAVNFIPKYRRLVIGLLMSVLVLNMACGIGVRLAFVLGQWEERSYQPLETAYRKYVPSGATVFGSPELWYAAVNNDNQFRVRDYFSSLAYPKYAVPNPMLHEYVVLNENEEYIVDALHYTYVAKYYQPVPELLGSIPSKGSPYNFKVWKRK